MKKPWFLFSVCLLLSRIVFAETATPVQREELFRRAFRSTSFIMLNAGNDAAFTKSLTPAELQTFYLILNTAHFANLRTSLIEQKAHNFGTATNEAFAFVMASNAGVKITFSVKSELVFSDDRKLFQLVSGEAERTAVTSSNPMDPIYVNRQLISRPEFPITFPSAVNLAVHEFGNKIGEKDKRDQKSIDAVAAKLQMYTEQNTRSFETPKGTLSITVFKNPPFEDLLQSSVSARIDQAPGALTRMWLTANEGFYAFFETDKGIKDISVQATQPLQTEPPRGTLDQMPYDWLKFRWYGAQMPKFKQTSETSVNLEMNLTRYYATIPFGNASSPAPTKYRPWDASTVSTAVKHIDEAKVSLTLDLSGETPTFRQARKIPQVLEDPSVRVEKVSSVRVKDGHVFTYRMPDTYKIKGFLTGAIVQPVLKIRYQDKTLEIWGKKKSGTKDLFEFHIPNPPQGGTIEVIGLEITEANNPNMTAKDVVRVKFLLPSTEKVELASGEGPVAREKFALKSLQMWDGSKWISLKHGTGPLTKGSHLRFIFDSATPLRSLDLLESYTNTVNIDAKAPPLPDLKFSQSDAVTDRLVHIPEEKLKQTLVGNKLIVDWQVDDGIPLKSTFKAQMDPKVFLEIWKNVRGMLFSNFVPERAYQEVTTEVTGKRKLSAVEAMNGQLESLSTKFATPLEFDKIATGRPALELKPGLSAKAAAKGTAPNSCSAQF